MSGNCGAPTLRKASPPCIWTGKTMTCRIGRSILPKKLPPRGSAQNSSFNASWSCLELPFVAVMLNAEELIWPLEKTTGFGYEKLV
jgi:hypothetical protein